ncbi:hypothetical protein EW146_g859 [Bondarzewia mesenterica]|uniref:SAM domain-containing protein n=1 Tax=Bondarzewia mesenterica TaxID=1095465 RepID=A0A4S4M5J3_9AGAM|nr:hypothetical protein EW146_g859 [Bondarzewia mesenterica]
MTSFKRKYFRTHRALIRHSRKKGLSFEKIARKFRCSASTVCRTVQNTACDNLSEDIDYINGIKGEVIDLADELSAAGSEEDDLDTLQAGGEDGHSDIKLEDDKEGDSDDEYEAWKFGKTSTSGQRQDVRCPPIAVPVSTRDHIRPLSPLEGPMGVSTSVKVRVVQHQVAKQTFHSPEKVNHASGSNVTQKAHRPLMIQSRRSAVEGCMDVDLANESRRGYTQQQNISVVDHRNERGRAVQRQPTESPVFQFLRGLGLEDLYKAFRSIGIETAEDLKELRKMGDEILDNQLRGEFISQGVTRFQWLRIRDALRRC